MGPEEWRPLVAEALRQRAQEPLLEMHGWQGYVFGGSSMLVTGEEDALYVLRPVAYGSGHQHELIANQLGQALGAPVGKAGAARIAAAARAADPLLRNLSGIYPVSAYLADHDHSRELRADLGGSWWEVIEPLAFRVENRPRWALLAIFYGWLGSPAKVQVLYEPEEPHHVVSVDQDDFLTEGVWQHDPHEVWPILPLRGQAAPFRPIVEPLGLTPDELGAAGAHLARITSEVIAAAVAAPPDEWGYTLDLRARIATGIALARDQMISPRGQ